LSNKRVPSLKEQSIWNLASGFLAAMETIVMTMAVNRVIDIEASGEITIAFALGNMFRTIGLWGTRNYHVSDQKEEYSYGDYLRTRLFCIFLMILVVISYLSFSFFAENTSIHKLLVIMIIEIVFEVECYEDVIWGEYQRHGRIDIGAKLFLIRWGSFLSTFVLMVIATKQLLPSLIVSLVVSLAVFFTVVTVRVKLPVDHSDNRKGIFINKKQKELLLKTAPLFLVAFFTFFLNNVAKYSLDRYFDLGLQACFGFITLPTFAVEMISGFIYQPRLAGTSAYYLNHQKKIFWIEISRQMGMIILITIICSVAAWLIGTPVLSTVFSTDLSLYRTDLLLNVIGGGAMAFGMYLSALLTIMRRQRMQLLIYGISALGGGIFVWEAVRRFGIRGGSIGNLAVYTFLSVLLFIVFIVFFFKDGKKNHSK